MQTTFSTPGVKAPKNQLGDDDLVDALKKVRFGKFTVFSYNLYKFQYKLVLKCFKIF